MNLNSKFLPDCWWHIYILQVIHVAPSCHHYKLLIPFIVLVCVMHCLFCILHFAVIFRTFTIFTFCVRHFILHFAYLHFAGHVTPSFPSHSLHLNFLLFQKRSGVSHTFCCQVIKATNKALSQS